MEAAAKSWPNFDELDVDCDGQISHLEATKLKEMSYVYADLDQSGTISRDEYNSYISRDLRRA